MKPVSFHMVATLEGIRAAEVSGSPMLKTQVSRRFREALLSRLLVEMDGAEIRTTFPGQTLLAGVSLGKRSARLVLA